MQSLDKEGTGKHMHLIFFLLMRVMTDI